MSNRLRLIVVALVFLGCSDERGKCATDTDSLCHQQGLECGPATVERCGEQVEISCGDCAGDLVCGIDAPNKCGCSSYAECHARGLACGTHSIEGCPSPIACGDCISPRFCSEAGQCECIGEEASELCAAAGAECGPVTAANRCGVEQTVECGACESGKKCLASACREVIRACESSGWCWENPMPSADEIIEMVMLSETDGWAIGRFGTVLHWDGAAWQGSPLPFLLPDLTLSAISATSPRNVWVLAKGDLRYGEPPLAIFLRWNGSTWQVIAQERKLLVDLAVVGENEAWACGRDGLYRWDGQALQAISDGNKAGGGR